ncbi:heavy metal translocating P-type ATPase [Sinorhizobium medicae]|nr:heavy metal translocating P-type ATPase [Sinorhizobium medicae]MDX1091374.1 heavy metal translocating P-type ATPase [Sinorhizobium medicae]MDX1116168.1 heavy metal translocating P-type ATPase [Sinorhizobium medicae]
MWPAQRLPSVKLFTAADGSVAPFFRRTSADEPGTWRRVAPDGPQRAGVHCGACITTIETALWERSEVERTRVNLSTRRVSIVWKEEVAGKRSDPGELVRALSERGYETHIFTPGEGEGDAVLKQLIRAVAVSGFAAANIMLLSVSVWSGADAATRDLFHWVSAMIAGPTLIYAATSSISPPGMRSATGGRTWTCRSHLPSLSPMPCRDDRPWGACLVRRDRDPSVLPAHRPDARLYDARPRTIRGLARLSSRGATVLHADGSPEYRAVGEIEPGERLMIAAGEGIPSTAAWYRHQRPGPLGRQLRERADFGQLG